MQYKNFQFWPLNEGCHHVNGNTQQRIWFSLNWHFDPNKNPAF